MSFGSYDAFCAYSLNYPKRGNWSIIIRFSCLIIITILVILMIMVIIIAIKVYNCYRMHLSLFHAMITEFVCVGRDGGGGGGGRVGTDELATP